MSPTRRPIRGLVLAAATALAVLAPATTAVAQESPSAPPATPLSIVPATPAEAPVPAPTPASDPLAKTTKIAATWEFSEHTGPYNVTGTYTPLVGDFAGGFNDDILWYGKGAIAEQAWKATGSGTFEKKVLGSQVNGNYRPIIGDFGGSARDDIFWYGKGSLPDALWINTGEFTFSSFAMSVNGAYSPVVLENGTEHDDIVWWAPGSSTSAVWQFSGSGGTHVSRTITPGPGTRPLVGHFTNDGLADIFWYGAGDAFDSLWVRKASGTFIVVPQKISGTYTPVVGDFGGPGDGIDDIFWHAGLASSIWVSNGSGSWTTRKEAAPTGRPIRLDLEWSTLYLWTPGQAGFFDYDYDGSPKTFQVVNNHVFGANYQPIVGNFRNNSSNILWYAPGAGAEYLWS